MKNCTNVIAGRPGAGKTSWACKEAARLAQDPNNIIFYIGHRQEFEKNVRLAGADKCNLFFAHMTHAGELIGRAIDSANAEIGLFSGMDLDNEPNERVVYLFYDQCRFDLFPGRRDLLDAAAKAGVIVYVLCQVYSQVSKGDEEWLTQNCNCFVISKSRPPRIATKEEISEKYSGKKE